MADLADDVVGLLIVGGNAVTEAVVYGCGKLVVYVFVVCWLFEKTVAALCATGVLKFE